MNSFNERVNVLTELLNEGHITEDEYLDLVDSLRGGSVNEVEGHSTDYDAEINNPNKLEDYEKFLSGDAFTDLHDPAFTDNAKEYQEFLDKIDNAKSGAFIPVSEDLLKQTYPLHNTFYHVIDQKEVDSATKHFLEQAKLYQEKHLDRGGRYNNSMNGLYKQDLRSGSILHDCSLRVDTGGNVECVMPFKDHPAYNEIRSALESGTITLS